MAKLTTAAINVQADALAGMLNGGYLRIFDDSLNLLAELRFAALAFRAAVDGVIKSYPLDRTKAIASGTASIFTAIKSDGVTVIMSGSGSDMNLTSVDIQVGAEISDISIEHTVRG